jgi:hypothetical protein
VIFVVGVSFLLSLCLPKPPGNENGGALYEWHLDRFSGTPLRLSRSGAVVRRRTKSRHEKIVCKQLETDGFDSYLPTARQSRQWTEPEKADRFPALSGLGLCPHFRISFPEDPSSSEGWLEPGRLDCSPNPARAESGFWRKTGGSLGTRFFLKSPPGKSARNPG